MQALISSWETMFGALQRFSVLDIIDILLVTFAIYQLLKLTWDTRANQVLKGFGIVFVAAQVSRWIGLTAVTWFFDYIINNLAVVLVIVFQPEFRRVLEQMGRGRIFAGKHAARVPREANVRAVNEIVHAVFNMSQSKTGALIVIQRRSHLGEILETGTAIDGKVSRPLIENIFVVNTPLHDGAMVVRDDRILAAGCFLPMTGNKDLAQDMGTRHRAALGMSEASDAFIIVVSEETGIVSSAESGLLKRGLGADMLRAKLMEIYTPEQKPRTLMDFLNVQRRKRS